MLHILRGFVFTVPRAQVSDKGCIEVEKGTSLISVSIYGFLGV